jgi:hypothetical protein
MPRAQLRLFSDFNVFIRQCKHVIKSKSNNNHIFLTTLFLLYVYFKKYVWHMPTAQLRLFSDFNVFIRQCKHVRVACASVSSKEKKRKKDVHADSI